MRHQNAFEELKTRVTTEPVLAHPILTDPFELEVDASGFAMGAVLPTKERRRKETSYSVLFKNTQYSRKELRRIRPGATRNSKHSRSLEAILSRVTTQNHHLFRPSKFTILEGTT
jgi:hypothetical protein